MTAIQTYAANYVIIPYQELLGNDDEDDGTTSEEKIIPYQELLGNDDLAVSFRFW